MKFNRLSSYLLTLCALLLCSAHTVHAAPYSLAPLLIDKEALPRDILNEMLVVENRTDTKVTLYPSVNDVAVGLEGGVLEFLPPSMSDRSASLSSWIELPRSGLELSAGERREIPLVIRVNPAALPGQYHAMIAYASGRTADEAMAAIQSGDAPTTLINLTISDDSNELLRIARFSIDKFVLKPSPDALSFELENSGDTDVKPSGDIIIYDQRGIERGSIAVNSEGASIPSGERRAFSYGVPFDGLFGKYKASLSVRYGETGSVINDIAYFFVFPWQKLAFTFGSFVVLALALALYMHRRYGGATTDDDGDEVAFVVRDSVSDAHERDVVMRRKNNE